MAIECQEKGIDSDELEIALSKDDQQVNRIVDAANRAHGGSTKITRTVTKDEAIDIIRNGFQWAHDFKEVPPDALEGIITYEPRRIVGIDPETLRRLHAKRIHKQYSQKPRRGKLR